MERQNLNFSVDDLFDYRVLYDTMKNGFTKEA